MNSIISNSLKKRFVKDMGLNIPIFESPYFEYFLDLYEKEFKAKSKFERFSKEVEDIQIEYGMNFMDYEDDLTTKVVNHIKNLSVFESYNNSKGQTLSEVVDFSFGEKNLYTEEYVWKEFISLDLKKANYQVFKYLFPSEFKSSWDEFLSGFTPYSHIRESKYFRQVVFGQLNPKRQIAVQKIIMHRIIDICQLHEFVLGVNNDEILLRSSVGDIENSLNLLPSELKNLELHIEKFKLDAVKTPAGTFFQKRFNDGTIKLKGVPTHFFAQVYKHINKIPIEETDKKFYFEGLIATFDKELF